MTEEIKNEEKIVKKKKKVLPIIIGCILIATLAVIAFVVINASGRKQDNVHEKIELAAQYLTDLDYENAIATYEEIIEIDPKAVDAYAGLANTYIAMADERIANKKYDEADANLDNALDVINRGLENVDSKDSAVLTDIQNLIEDRKNNIADINQKAKEEEKESSKEAKKETKKKEDKKEETKKDTDEEEKPKEKEKEKVEEKEEIEQQNNQAEEQKYIDPYGEEWTKEEIIENYAAYKDLGGLICSECGGKISKETVQCQNVIDENGNSSVGYLHECSGCGLRIVCYTEDGRIKQEECVYCGPDHAYFADVYNWMLTTGVVN